MGSINHGPSASPLRDLEEMESCACCLLRPEEKSLWKILTLVSSVSSYKTCSFPEGKVSDPDSQDLRDFFFSSVCSDMPYGLAIGSF